MMEKPGPPTRRGSTPGGIQECGAPNLAVLDVEQARRHAGRHALTHGARGHSLAGEAMKGEYSCAKMRFSGTVPCSSGAAKALVGVGRWATATATHTDMRMCLLAGCCETSLEGHKKQAGLAHTGGGQESGEAGNKDTKPL